MYHVIATVQNKDYPLLEPPDEECILIEPQLNIKMGRAGALTFDISMLHPYREHVRPYETYIRVLKNGDPLWYGRVIGISEDFYKTASVTCEGELAYLNDTIIPDYSFAGDIPEYIGYILGIHNTNVEEAKRIYPGEIDVTDENGYLVRASKQYPDALSELTEKLIDTYGGYFRTRHVSGKIYLDYVYVYGHPNEQVLRPDENILDYESRIGGDFYTRLIPLGDDVGNGDAAKPLTVASVNSGKIYVDNDALVEKYGIIEGVMKWPDVTVPKNLLAKGTLAVLEQELPSAFGLKAVDLSVIDADAEYLQLGCTTTVISPFHGLEAAYLLTAINMNLDSPERDEFLFGDMVSTFTGSTAAAQAEAKSQINIARQEMIHYSQVEAAEQAAEMGRIITGTNAGNVWINAFTAAGSATAPTALYVLDNPDKERAEKVIRFDVNGISVSTTGIDGTYTVVLPIGGTGFNINPVTEDLTVLQLAQIVNLKVSGVTELADLYLTGKWGGQSLSAVIEDIYSRIGG